MATGPAEVVRPGMSQASEITGSNPASWSTPMGLKAGYRRLIKFGPRPRGDGRLKPDNDDPDGPFSGFTADSFRRRYPWDGRLLKTGFLSNVRRTSRRLKSTGEGTAIAKADCHSGDAERSLHAPNLNAGLGGRAVEAIGRVFRHCRRSVTREQLESAFDLAEQNASVDGPSNTF